MTRRVIDLGLGTILTAGHDSQTPVAASRRYGPADGFQPLREALAQLEGVAADNVVITTGASLGIASALVQLARPGSVLLPRPYYPSYPGLVECLGLQTRFYRLLWSDSSSTDVRLDLETVATEIRRQARAIIVNTPGNPLGNLAAASDMRDLLDLAATYDCLVIVDEVYSDFIYDRAATDWRGWGMEPHLVRVKSFSKSLQAPGERVGYVVAEHELARRIGQAHWLLAMSPPVPGQMRAAQALVENSQRFDRLLLELRHNRDLMASKLAHCDGLKVRRPRAGIFYWLEVAGRLDSVALGRLCLERAGVRVTPGAHFGVDDPPTIRCSFALERTDLREALGRLVETLDSLS